MSRIYWSGSWSFIFTTRDLFLVLGVRGDGLNLEFIAKGFYASVTAETPDRRITHFYMVIGRLRLLAIIAAKQVAQMRMLLQPVQRETG